MIFYASEKFSEAFLNYPAQKSKYGTYINRYKIVSYAFNLLVIVGEI